VRQEALVDATDVDDAHQPYALQPAVHRPPLRQIIRHLALSLLTATVIPSVLFSVILMTTNIWTALIVAMVWCYGFAAWRFAKQGRASGLLLMTLIGLTAKTVFAFASGSTTFYFIQPAITDTVIASLFFASLTTARPMVARLAADFYPMDDEVAGRPRIQRLFWWLSLFWAGVCLVKAAVTLWLLQELSTVDFVAVKGALITAIIVCATAVTVATAARVARSEGLLHRPVAA
jgi:hypothetical protein